MIHRDEEREKNMRKRQGLMQRWGHCILKKASIWVPVVMETTTGCKNLTICQQSESKINICSEKKLSHWCCLHFKEWKRSCSSVTLQWNLSTSYYKPAHLGLCCPSGFILSLIYLFAEHIKSSKCFFITILG